MTMYYCVIHYPKIDSTKIEELRRNYDPTYEHIKAHITLVFPIKTDDIGKEDLERHIEEIIAEQSSFDIKLAEFEKSWDNWLLLGLEKGRNQIVTLHDELYSGILKPFWRKDLPFSPHISLGQFNEKGTNYSLKNPEAVAFDNELYEKALKEAEEAKLVYETTFDKVTLITLNDELTDILESRDFLLK